MATEGYQKQRFIIIDTPNSFGNDITKFHYKAYSREYENKFVRVLEWPGVLINEYKDQKTAASFEQEVTFALSQPPVDTDLIRAEIVKDFVYRLPSLFATPNPLNFSVGAKQSTIKIYGFIEEEWVQLSNTEARDYEIVLDSITEELIINFQFGGTSVLGDYDSGNEIPIYIDYKLETPLTLALTKIEGAPRTSVFDFYYDSTAGANGSITCFVPRIPLLFSKNSVSFYEADVHPDSTIKVNIYYETNQNISEELLNTYTTKDGLQIGQVLSSLFNNSGDEDNTDAR